MVKDIVINRENETILILISYKKRYSSHPKQEISLKKDIQRHSKENIHLKSCCNWKMFLCTIDWC